MDRKEVEILFKSGGTVYIYSIYSSDIKLDPFSCNNIAIDPFRRGLQSSWARFLFCLNSKSKFGAARPQGRDRGRIGEVMRSDLRGEVRNGHKF